jgi:Arc/MetJ family transcription regulator
MLMARTTIDVDRDALRRAGEALGTTGASATVNAALREVGRRRALADFDVRRDIDGSPQEVAQGRAVRAADER